MLACCYSAIANNPRANPPAPPPPPRPAPPPIERGELARCESCFSLKEAIYRNHRLRCRDGNAHSTYALRRARVYRINEYLDFNLE